MANPQIEDGYTKIANEIMDALISAHLSGQEMSVALFVIRKTYGFNKTEDFISLSQMMAAVGMSKIRASQVVRSLELMKILTVTENINGLTKKYKFNKDFDQWDTVKENLNRKGFTKQTVKVLRNRPLRKTLTTKETITKETITKEIPPIIPQKQKVKIPGWVPLQTFETYQASRTKKLKPASFEGFFKKLERLAKISRASPEEILNQSIDNGWQGIFELKQKGGGNGSNRSRNIGISAGPAFRKTQTARSDGEPYPVDFVCNE